MDKNAIKSYLKSYRQTQENIDIASGELSRLQSAKTEVQGRLSMCADGMPRAPGVSDTTYTKCLKAMELYDSEISLQRRTLEELQKRMVTIGCMIAAAGHRRIGQILYKHYCQGVIWAKIAAEMHYSVRQIKRYAYGGLSSIEKKMARI